jgi:cell division protein FtsW (lipid II flippase)
MYTRGNYILLAVSFCSLLGVAAISYKQAMLMLKRKHLLLSEIVFLTAVGTAAFSFGCGIVPFGAWDWNPIIYILNIMAGVFLAFFCSSLRRRIWQAVFNRELG